jgi:hypothetical protein
MGKIVQGHIIYKQARFFDGMGRQALKKGRQYLDLRKKYLLLS